MRRVNSSAEATRVKITEIRTCGINLNSQTRSHTLTLSVTSAIHVEDVNWICAGHAVCRSIEFWKVRSYCDTRRSGISADEQLILRGCQAVWICI